MLHLPVQQRERLVMVVGVENEAVLREDDPFCAPFFSSQGVNVALGVRPVLGKKTFIVAEPVTADAHARCYRLQGTAFPAQRPGVLLGHEVQGQLSDADLRRHDPGRDQGTDQGRFLCSRS